MKTLTLLILSALTLLAQDQSVYTLTGQKTPRLDARYTITYVATNLKEGCGSRGYTTGTMKPSMTQRSMSVPDGNYTINLPIYMTTEEDKAECGYRFGGLDLTMRRKNDDDQFSRFQLLGDFRRYTNTQEPLAIYRGWKGGEGGSNFIGMDTKDAPDFTNEFSSNKKYFRIAPETTFVCMTQYLDDPRENKEWHEKHATEFMCTMKMKLDTEGGKFHFNKCTREESLTETQHHCSKMTHPDFGVDEITSDTLRIDILVDEPKCQLLKISRFKVEREVDTFREVPKPVPSALESFKSLF
ncbi:hypothetical protein [Sulfuricurvum sp.]|uniref:hypothetical protein n=1 Tax=Sulfuricurvum sp. TaxID=2025608 RepID=UPI003BB7ED95